MQVLTLSDLAQSNLPEIFAPVPSGACTSGFDATNAAYSVAPELRLQSDWSQHSLIADPRGSYTGYSPQGTLTFNAPRFNGTVDGRIEVPRTPTSI